MTAYASESCVAESARRVEKGTYRRWRVHTRPSRGREVAGRPLALALRGLSSMEQRLAAFRASRKRAELEGGPNSSERRGKTSGEDAAAAAPASPLAQGAPGRSAKETLQTHGSPLQNPTAISSSRWDQSFLTNLIFLKVALWLVLLGLFVELEFGLVYFVLSLFYWMYVGTRGPGEKKKGEKSAYSVFNPGCEPIQGTLTAEQFERELQYHPLAVR